MSSEISLDDRVRKARERREGRRSSAAADAPVQLAVRLPPEVRERVHRAAAAAGSASTQEWLERVIAGAVEDALNPSRRAAAHLREVLLASLAEQVDSGAYAAVVADLGRDDPTLA